MSEPENHTSVDERPDRPSPEPASREGGVPAARAEARRVHGPFPLRVNERDVGPRARCEHHVRAYRLAPDFVRDARNRDLSDCGVPGEDLLDLLRPDVQAPDDDRSFLRSTM